ncbi:MAG TPA: phosphotransferase [Acidimicrobiales bacterium]|nr:phosphotransferase [Acidimicrobiales bacterium]
MQLERSVVDAVAAGFAIGEPGDVVLAARGWVSLNLVWRFSTGLGMWAVKEVARESRSELEAAAEIEAAAALVGVPAPRMIRTTAGAVTLEVAGRVFRCHEFVDGRAPVPGASRHDAASAGGALGLLHSAALPWDPVLRSQTVFGESHWLGLIDRGARGGAAWVDALRRALPGILAAESAASEWRDRAHRWIGSHRDVRPDNTMRVGDTLLLVDWDGAGPVVRGREVVGALEWWRPHDDAFLSAYVDVAGEVDLEEGRGEDGGLVWWLETNVEHALALPHDEERDWAVSTLAGSFARRR